MTNFQLLSPEAMLHELMPTVESALDKHLASSTEWFPHEYVPYEEGRNYLETPWAPEQSRLPDVAQTALEVNLLTEDNLPFYHLALWETFGNTDAWGEWVRRWTAEEGRHAIVIRDYLVVTRGMDPVQLERGRMDMVQRGWYPGFAKIGPLDGVVFTTIQELATRISHRNTGAITEDASALRLTQRVATDENLHYVFYRDMATSALELDPSSMLLAMARQIPGFAMPGVDMPGFRQKAKAMAQAGIYNFGIHLDQVLKPVLLTHWKIEELKGLSDEAERARDEVMTYLERLGRIAAKIGEPASPHVLEGALADASSSDA